MIHKRLLVLAVASVLVSPAFAAELRKVDNAIPGQYIVVFNSDEIRERVDADRLAGRLDKALVASPDAAVAAEVEKRVVDVAAQHDLKVTQLYTHALHGMVVNADDRKLASLLNDPRVDFVEQDGYVELSATQTGATWGLDRIDQRDRPLNGTYVYDPLAANVRAYIIDSGIRTGHTQFGTRLLSGYSAINDGRGSNDCNGHGTHVAGTVGGTTWGVAKQVRLVPVRVFGCTGGSANSTIIAGIDWVRANRVLPAVANMSLGGPASTATDNATNNLINSGVTVVVAAGNNNGANACNYSPARVANAVTVGSTTSTDARSSFSNIGSCVNIFAPGSSITSAWSTSTSASNTISGTSMASPHVAGAAALYLTNNPSASPATVRNWLYSNSTPNRVSNPGTGSPNRLLYTR
ncbi:S8 family peptidase [Luteimonas fraxinea]|uniref:S8 family peptidase n=1 Tax=Luteimonas fraxinea TaxID=2901869 RepID=A0ABS8U8J0_9GAMM|nr:S8 family peptidase [Luteimonas fraxinea]MCD9095880.1 S8 family peptidase [Luteimonas fraxinea]MCD9124469.1 S8 family peptidase [Luteimonas fraxinea]UHH10941.1 S8 family peptidase [Luteimonas fraxinea]